MTEAVTDRDPDKYQDPGKCRDPDKYRDPGKCRGTNRSVTGPRTHWRRTQGGVHSDTGQYEKDLPLIRTKWLAYYLCHS